MTDQCTWCGHTPHPAAGCPVTITTAPNIGTRQTRRAGTGQPEPGPCQKGGRP